MDDHQSDTVIRLSELATTKLRRGLLPMSPATVWRLVKDPNAYFPKPFKLAPKVTVWRKREVLDWIDSKSTYFVK